MSARRSRRPFDATLTPRMSSSDWNEPETPSPSFSSPVCRLAVGFPPFRPPHRPAGVGAIDPNPRQLLGRELDEDLLVLPAENLDARNVGDPQQPPPDVLDVVAQLALREPVGSEAVDDPEGIA